VAGSLPEARVGSAWQQGPGVRAWITTTWTSIRTPRASARRIEMEPHRARSLRRVNTAIAAGLITGLPGLSYGVQLVRSEAPYAFRNLTWPWTEASVRTASFLILLAGWWILAVLGFSFLTSVETWGLRFFGRMHNSRITPTVARAITAHATAGWVLSSTLVSSGFVFGLAMYEHAMHNRVGDLRGVYMLGPIWLPTFIGLAGLLTFEMIVYTGVRQCRFANRSRPEA
jgi:hypothetical protein